MGFIGFHCLLLGLARFFGDIMDFTGFDCLLLGFTGFFG